MTFFSSAKIVIRDPVHKEKILLVQRKIQDKVFYEPAGGKVHIDPKYKKAETLEAVSYTHLTLPTSELA